jgi:hypothetical protein
MKTKTLVNLIAALMVVGIIALMSIGMVNAVLNPTDPSIWTTLFRNSVIGSIACLLITLTLQIVNRKK